MIVKKFFIDKMDKSVYNPGDVYPRGDLKADDSRIADLTAKGYIAEDPVEEPEAKPLERKVDEDKKPAKKTKPKKKGAKQ